MKVIIAGSRDQHSMPVVFKAIKASGFDITRVICGGAHGVDEIGKTWANWNKIPVEIFYADWNLYGKAAGPIRNREMAEYADALIAIWDGKSKGTDNMIKEMQKLNKPCFVYIYGEE